MRVNSFVHSASMSSSIEGAIVLLCFGFDGRFSSLSTAHGVDSCQWLYFQQPLLFAHSTWMCKHISRDDFFFQIEWHILLHLIYKANIRCHHNIHKIICAQHVQDTRSLLNIEQWTVRAGFCYFKLKH